MEGLTQAVTACDPKGVERYAHAIKGLSANICAEPVKRVASQMESAGKAGQKEHWESLYGDLKKELERLQAHLAEILPPQTS